MTSYPDMVVMNLLYYWNLTNIQQKKINALRQKIEENFKEFNLSFSYGISIFPDDIEDINMETREIIKQLIEIADKRMYEDKTKREKVI